MSFSRWLVSTALAAMLLGSVVLAQDPSQDAKQAQLRTVHGDVVDKNDAPVPSAVLYLRNTRNNDVRTSFSDQGGAYRFSGLDPNVDYEIHAEKDDLESLTRTVSSFDSRKEIVFNLKLNKKKH